MGYSGGRDGARAQRLARDEAQSKEDGMRYEVHRLTGATLMDASGRPCGLESAGVVSRHRTREAAERAARAYRRDCPLAGEVEIRER